mmetsp:Transcript_114635/g.370425  ORF Transcript_114635/g.370425 Transcript_114635/m.370425 type:complete len:269 (+) Transcript_114635:420-1226(+)
MRGVWKAPDVFSTFACRAPALSATSFSFRMASSEPATEKPLGKSSLAIWHTAPLPSFLAASAQRTWSFGLSKPATESMACLLAVAAAFIASPRIFTSFNPSSTEKTPATQSAVYSPSERPATTWQRVTASSRSIRSFSTPAKPATNNAGWQLIVSSSFDSGPLMQRSSRSKPKMVLAFARMSLTAGMSLVVAIIFTYWEPWPGNRRPMGSGFCVGAAANAAAMKSSASSSGSANSPPYLAGSSPCFLAAPGRIKYHPLAGFLPCSQQP